MSSNAAEVFLRSYDSRQMPRYTVGQIATYLREPESTIRAWFFGMPYGKKPHIRHFKPILRPAGRDLLSFFDAASAHVLLALKAKKVSTEDIRAIVQTLENLPERSLPVIRTEFLPLWKKRRH